MQRLILARPKKKSFQGNFRDLIKIEDFSDEELVNEIFNKTSFNKKSFNELINKHINTKKLNPELIFQKLLNAKFGKIAQTIITQLSLEENIKNEIQQYNFNDLCRSLIYYIKTNLQDKDSNLYKIINDYINEFFNKPKIANIQNLTIESIQADKNMSDIYQTYLNAYNMVNSNYNFYFGEGDSRFSELPQYLLNKIAESVTISSKDELFNIIDDEKMQKKLLQIRNNYIEEQGCSDPAAKLVVEWIFKMTNTDIIALQRNSMLMKSIVDLLYKDDNFIALVSAGLKHYIESNPDLMRIFAKNKNVEINNRKNIELNSKGIKPSNSKNKNININSRDIDIKNESGGTINSTDIRSRLSKYSPQEIKQLPKLMDMNNKNDSIGDNHDVSLVQFFVGNKVIVTEDGRVAYNSAEDNNVRINDVTDKLQKEQKGYVFAVVNNGVMCIYQENNINNLNNIINGMKNNMFIPVNKIYRIENRVNFVTNIVRKARLAKLLWEKQR